MVARKTILDGINDLNKTEIAMYKLKTKSSIEPEEIKIALQIVPRYVLSFLFEKFKEIGNEYVISLYLPFAPDCLLEANRIENDQFSGRIVRGGKEIAQFQNRSLPGVGLIIMSTLELYDVNMLDKISSKDCHSEDAQRLQELIDQRIKLHNYIADIESEKIAEKDAIQAMINDRLSQILSPIVNLNINNTTVVPNTPIQEPIESTPAPIALSEEPVPTMELTPMKQKSKLKEFLQKRDDKKYVKFLMNKAEVSCPDCGSVLMKNEKSVKLCICYGQFFNKELKIKKNENNQYSIAIPKSFDQENTEMLLAIFRKQ